MGFIRDNFLGGAEKRAAGKEVEGIEAGQDFIRQGVEQARGDIQSIFPQAQQALQSGTQGALNIFGQAIPQQANVFQQGNVAAQQQIAAGLPQFQNAILGRPVDFSQFQPTQLQQPDFSFLQAQLPQAQNPFATPTPDPATVGPIPFGGSLPAPLIGGPLITPFGGSGGRNTTPFSGQFSNRRMEP